MNIPHEDIVFLQTGGSHLYGLNTIDSDEDLRGVALLSDLSLYFGYLTRFEQKDSWDDHPDKEVYEFRKAIRLIADGNPNMVDLAFSKFHQVCTPEWSCVLDNKDKFLSFKMKHTYSGYAHAQFKKLKNSFERGTSENWNEYDLKAGYKCKYAMHMVRLLRMAVEILRDGEVRVFRHDADELMGIRYGEWTYSDCLLYMDKMNQEIESIDSSLPGKVDHAFWDALCVNVVSGKILEVKNGM